MAQSFFKIDIKSEKFPLLAEKQTRTIMEIVRAETPTKDDLVGIQYCHNVMPTLEGMQSVGFITAVVDSPDVGAEFFHDTRTVYAQDSEALHPRRGERLTMAWDTAGDVYVLIDFISSWLKLASSPVVGPNFSGNDITIGTVDGVSYIFYSEQTCYVFDITTLLLVETPLTGLTLDEVLGVVGSSGYLIAYSKNAIAWSSTVTPTDFAPGIGGAGGGNVAGIQGNIIFGISNTLGILLFTEANCISATYTGNSDFPFKFRPIADAKGGVNLDRVAYEPDTNDIFAYTKAGLQQVNATKADTILPEVTDFLAGGRFDFFNVITQEYTTVSVPPATTIRKKVKYIASRYLVISYDLGTGTGTFTFALIYDLALNRLGKIFLEHVDVFDYVGGSQQDEVSKQSIAFLTNKGEVLLVDFNVETPATGVLILGKVGISRTRMMSLLGVTTENVLEGAAFTVGSLVALDGKNGVYVEGTLSSTEPNQREHKFKNVGKNHSIVYEGQFNINTALVRYTVNGRR